MQYQDIAIKVADFCAHDLYTTRPKIVYDNYTSIGSYTIPDMFISLNDNGINSIHTGIRTLKTSKKTENLFKEDIRNVYTFVVAHEMMHHYQFMNKALNLVENVVHWNGEPWLNDNLLKYDPNDLPWEIQANNYGEMILTRLCY